MRKVPTGCCALAQIDQVSNDTPIEVIEGVLDVMQVQMKDNTEVGITTGHGQTATFTIVSPGEDILEKNLIKLGYEHVYSFPRRVGYPQLGDLKLYIINLT